MKIYKQIMPFTTQYQEQFYNYCKRFKTFSDDVYNEGLEQILYNEHIARCFEAVRDDGTINYEMLEKDFKTFKSFKEISSNIYQKLKRTTKESDNVDKSNFYIPSGERDEYKEVIEEFNEEINTLLNWKDKSPKGRKQKQYFKEKLTKKIISKYGVNDDRI